MELSAPFNKMHVDIDTDVSECNKEQRDCKQASDMKEHWPYLTMDKCQTDPESKIVHEEECANCASRSEQRCFFVTLNDKCSPSSQDNYESKQNFNKLNYSKSRKIT